MPHALSRRPQELAPFEIIDKQGAAHLSAATLKIGVASLWRLVIAAQLRFAALCQRILHACEAALLWLLAKLVA